jgi:hypothetical protein
MTHTKKSQHYRHSCSLETEIDAWITIIRFVTFLESACNDN